PDDAVGLHVDGEIPDGQDAAPNPAPAPQHRPHAHQQLRHDERLHDVVVAADIEAAEDVFDAGGAGEEEEGHFPGRPDAPGHGDPADPVAEMDVEESDVGQERRHGSFDPAAVSFGLYLV